MIDFILVIVLFSLSLVFLALFLRAKRENAALQSENAALQSSLLTLERSSLPIGGAVRKLVKEAVPLIEKMDGVPGRSGPNKREYVYKQMVRDNPAADLRDISLAIEKGIQEALK